MIIRADALMLAMNPLEEGEWLEIEWLENEHGDKALRLLERELVSKRIQSVMGTRCWTYYSTVLRCDVHVLRVSYR
jgi:hypothetical protein